jgi:transcriptional regulator with XRE-family HTH domain
MASAPIPNRTYADFDRFDVLQRIGGALGRVKRDRRLTLADMAEALGRSDDQLARYIAGEDMPVSLWMKALALWPELADKFEETVAERAMQSRQVPLDLPEVRA